MIIFRHRGNFKKTEKFIYGALDFDVLKILRKYGAEGVAALSAATPVDSGETARSWDYNVTFKRGSYTLTWTNSHFGGDTPVAILIQYGHGRKGGSYIPGRDFINPAMLPIFDRIVSEIFAEVSKL